MSCPTCDHTMQTVLMDRERTIRHCPRCGTMRSVLLGHTDDTVPKCVGLLRDFVRMISPSPQGRYLRNAAEAAGILEAVHKPADRPA